MKTIIYLRKSRSDETREDSLENHRFILTNLCKNNGWNDYEVLEEIGTSQSIEKREQMTKLIYMIETGLVKRVVIMDIDRLSRESFDIAFIRKLFINHNIELVTPQKIFDWNNEGDLMLFGFSSIIGEQEYRQIRKRMMLGKVIQAQNGYWVNGSVPLGYKKNRDTRMLDIVEEEYKIYRYMIDCIISGEYSNFSLAYHLNDIGYKTKFNSLWNASRVKAVVTNKVYLGYVKHENKFYKGRHTPLITEEEYHQVIEQLKGNRIPIPRQTRDKKKKLSGICRCGICGRLMTPIADYRTSEVKYFLKCNHLDISTKKRCPNRGIKESIVVKSIENTIENHINDLEECIKEGRDNTQKKQIKQYKEKLKQIDNQIDKLNKRVLKSKELAKEGILTISEVKDEIKSCNDKINNLNDDKKQIEYLLETSSKDIKKELIMFKDAFDKVKSCTNDEKYNNILRTIISKVKYTRLGNEVEIDVDFL